MPQLALATLALTSIEALRVTSYAFAGLALTSSLYFVLATFAALRARALLRSATPSRSPVSLLVPLCGAEPRLHANLLAALEALGPEDELIVGTANGDDPALAVARGIEDERLRVVAGSASRATNRKVATLVALEPHATRDVIVLADSDVRIDATMLARLAGSVGPSGHALATALYRGAPSGSFASRIEALAINADFVPSVLVADLLAGGIQFALGAANAVRRDALAAIGGFASLGEVLADDHHLGKRIVAAGFSMTIAPVCVPIVQESRLRDTFARLLRWCRTYRVCQPAGYAATAFSHHGVAASLAATAAWPTLWPLAAATIALRIVTATVAHMAIAGRAADLSSMPLLPFRDLIATALFSLAWLGRTVTWRGRRFRVATDGTLTLIGSAEPDQTPAALLAASGGR